MSLRRMILEDYQECVKLAKIPTELKDALKTHERVPNFITDLVKQIQSLPANLQPNRMKLKEIVYSVTEYFFFMFKQKCDQDALSALEKSRIRAEEQTKKDIDSTLSGKPAGDFAGLIEEINDGTTKTENRSTSD